MKYLTGIGIVRRTRIAIGVSILRGAGVDIVYEIRLVSASSERDIIGRRLARHDVLDDAIAEFENTSVPIGYQLVLSARGSIFESAVNRPILERGAVQPAKQEPSRHDPMVAALIRPDLAASGLNGGIASLGTVPPPATSADVLNVATTEDGALVLDEGVEMTPAGWLLPADHFHNTLGPLVPLDDALVPSCSICGEPQPGEPT